MAGEVVVGRAVFGLLGLVTFCTVLFTILTDGPPFRMELLTKWMVATLIDFYVNVVPIAVWVWYKELSWLSASMWTILLICFGSMTTCWYIAFKLFKLSPEDPMYFVLLKESHVRLLSSKKENDVHLESDKAKLLRQVPS